MEVGDINHSAPYVGAYGSSVAKVVRDRLKGHLTRPLKATGRRPRVKILADKFTHMHITRQVIIAYLMFNMYESGQRTNFYFSVFTLVIVYPRLQLLHVCI